MDNNDPIQQSNLVTDDAVDAMGGAPAPIGQPPAAPAEPSQPVEPAAAPAPDPMPISEPAPVAEPAQDTGDLDVIKKNALDELQPLLKHVEQSPEERYETIMMMIRTNDDASLIGQAYDAAKEISDERDRASALLNIVSEIEYLKSKTNS
jgi:hypothetical protein